MKNILRLISIGILLNIMLIGYSNSVVAAPSIQWSTDNVYYDSLGKLVVEGYFYNNGTRTITWIDEHNVQVFFRTRASDWWLQADTTFSNLNVYIKPGQISRWTFRITNVAYSRCDYWLVDWQTDYKYL